MSQDVRMSDVLTPTASSVGLSIGGVALAFFFIVLPRLGGDAILSLLFGEDASSSLINSSKENYGSLLDNLLSNDLLGRAAVFGVWMFVGLCVYILLTFLIGVFKNIEDEKHELSYIHQNKDSLLQSDIILISFRLGVAALWALFVTVCIRWVLSYFAVTGFVALGQGSPVDWAIFAVAAVILGVALHTQVIFARLIVGRTRILT